MHQSSPTPAARGHRTGFAPVLCGLILAAAAVIAEEPAAEGDPARGEETVYSLFVKGGMLMYPILLCSIIVVTLAIERAISMRRRRVGSMAVLDQVTGVLPSRGQAGPDRLRKAIQTSTAGSTLVGKLLEQGLTRLHRDEAHVQTAMEESAAKEMHRLHRRLRPFAVIATVAPLLGLLGTVMGMVVCFGEASAAEATERAQTLSDGIYQALITTVAGLIVAIPAVLLHHLYVGRVDSVIDLLDETSTRFLDHFYGGRSLLAAEQPGEEPGRAGARQERRVPRDPDRVEPDRVDLPRSAATNP